MTLPALGNAPTCDPLQQSGLYAAYLTALAERGAELVVPLGRALVPGSVAEPGRLGG